MRKEINRIIKTNISDLLKREEEVNRKKRDKKNQLLSNYI